MPPDNEKWIDAINPHLVSARMAWFLCQKTKAELVEAVENLAEDEEVWDGFRGILRRCAAVGRFDSLCLRAVVRLGAVSRAGLPVVALIDSRKKR